MNNKEKKMMSKLKVSSVQLRVNYQLPLELVKAINRLNDNSTIKEISTLMTLSEHYLRVRGYYKKYPQMETQSNDEIIEFLQHI